MNLAAGRGIAIREFPLVKAYGTADYMLYGDRKALGTVEAKKEGETHTGVEVQSEKYSVGLLVGPLRGIGSCHSCTNEQV